MLKNKRRKYLLETRNRYSVLAPKAMFHISANVHEEASATKKQIMERKGVRKCL